MEQKENETGGRVKRPDEEPGFWAEYVPPVSYISDAISYPMTCPTWPDRVVNAYRKDAGCLRKSRHSTTSQPSASVGLSTDLYIDNSN